MARTPQEIFEHHAQAIGAGDLDGMLADYAEDAVLVTPQGSVQGRQAIGEAFTGMLAQLPHATFDMYNQVYADDVLLVEWAASGPTGRITDGVDTMVFRGDEIRVQTVRFTVQPTP